MRNHSVTMETITLDQDIKVFYVTAASFPKGIAAAHEKVHALVPPTPSRQFFGISRPEEDIIVYKAAAEELYPGEGEQLTCPTMLIKKGKYLSTIIHNYMDDPDNIGRVFQQIIHQPGIDPEGYCVECYLSNTELRCMVRLAPTQPSPKGRVN